MRDEEYVERNLSYEEIRRHGALGNLNAGIEIQLHGIPTRLIAWPGNGFQTESIHVLTVAPGKKSVEYNYQFSEEAFLCLKGKGEVFLRDKWVKVEAGDLVYFPENTTHAVRNPKTSAKDFVLVSSISPPSFDLYEPAGFYDRKRGVMDIRAVQQAKARIIPGKISTKCELHYHDSHPDLRAWNLEVKEIRKHGGLFNIFKGASFEKLGASMRFILWPGYGTRTAGFHSVRLDPGQIFYIHTHPTSDECVINYCGKGLCYVGNRWVEFSPNDCFLAPCGVMHGGPYNNSAEPILAGGFASPPQLDLYLLTDYYEKGRFKRPTFKQLKSL